MEIDQEEALILSDDESGCGSEIESPYQVNTIITFQEKCHFLLTAVLLAGSSSILVIIMPLYIEAINVQSDAYCSLIFTGTVATASLAVFSLIFHMLSSREVLVNIPLIRVLRVGGIQGVASVIILFAMDRKRVLCHLQDPILGVCLAFSLSFYFIFCEKVMGLQRIFSAMVIIVGVFISIDYQLCNEFRCHGNTRGSEHTTSAWAWGSHLAWAFLCAVGLALWALAYALLENDVIRFKAHFAPSLLTTVSRLVATREIDPASLDKERSAQQDNHSSFLLSERKEKSTFVLEEDKKKETLNSVAHSLTLAASLAAAQLSTTVLLAWTAMFRPLGKASSPTEWWSLLMSGLVCHVTSSECSGVAAYGWIFALSYSAMLVSTVHFISLSESSIFTLACGSVALPIAGAWWSLFSSRNAVLVWAPMITGELICSLLGLPIVMVGLAMLCRAHWIEIKYKKLIYSPT